MKILNKFIIYFFIFFFFSNTCGQGIAIGQWRDHLPYNSCVSVTEAENRIYCATKYCLFYYNKEDNSINRLTKISGLSDIGISVIKYSKQYKTLIIAYNNTNIDLIVNDEIINIPDIKRKPILGKKTINRIFFLDKYAYLCCGFGIVVFDFEKKEIKDTYYIGEEASHIDVLDLTSDGSKFFAATEDGIYKASVNSSNLANYESWSKDTSISNPDKKYNAIEYFENKIFVNQSNTNYNTDTMFVYDGTIWNYFDSVNTSTKYCIKSYNDILLVANNYYVTGYDSTLNICRNVYSYFPNSPNPRQVIMDDFGYIWIADEKNGLVRYLWDGDITKIIPNGPATNSVIDISVQGNNLWVATGGKNGSWNNLWMSEGIFSFVDEKWNTLNRENTPALDTIFDIINIVVDPGNNKRVFAGSWGRGLIEFNNGNLTNIYNEKNSPLKVVGDGSYYWIGVGGMCFDDDNNLWIINSGVGSALVVKKNDNTWESFDFGSFTNGKTIGNLIIDSYNQKWIIIPRGNGILVFDDANPVSLTGENTNPKKLNINIGSGNLPSNNIFCLAKDLDGEIWVGTDAGIAVFYSPENIFTGSDFDAQQILVEQDGYVQHLLEFETVTAIAVDGSNKKWIGTERAGIFLMSADGTEQILHFTEDNSPLFSNTITSIAINHQTGEVFIGTSKGIVSYKGEATMPTEKYENVYVYPNPVRENYNGLIAIKGLVREADIKITDISGNLIYTTKAQGGQAIWNGKNFNGDKAHTGVYLIFSSNEDGSETLVTKILVIN